MPDMREPAIAAIAELPARIRAAAAGLTNAQLDTPYRPGGWTVRQVVHHVADSHMNGNIRTKLALTEHEPTIKPYDQDSWAPLPDSRLPIDISLAILDGVHERWVVVWRSLRHHEPGRAAPGLRVALAPSRGAHHVAAPARGVARYVASGCSRTRSERLIG